MDIPQKTRRFGIISGLGTPAAHYYYDGLLAECEGRNISPDFFIANANFSLVLEKIRSDDRAGLAQYLSGLVRDLQNAGAGTAALTAVMPHICMPELRDLSPLPIIDIVDVLTEHLARRGVKAVALLGTEVTMRSKLFGRLADFTICDLSDREIGEVQRIYTSIQRAGRASGEAVDFLKSLCTDIHTRRGPQEIVIAGTDLAAVFDRHMTDFPFANAAHLHVEAIARWANN